jgi:regulator of nucleoside diphosphate kinase
MVSSGLGISTRNLRFVMTLSPPIIVASEDRARLQLLIEQQMGATKVADQLESELERARVVSWQELPADVVVMNGELEYEDTASGQRRRLRLVYPADADSSAGKISVLAPLGCALLGLRVGQEIDWRMPGGLRRLRVVAATRPDDALGTPAHS